MTEQKPTAQPEQKEKTPEQIKKEAQKKEKERAALRAFKSKYFDYYDDIKYHGYHEW